jgi:hypothetical protein
VARQHDHGSAPVGTIPHMKLAASHPRPAPEGAYLGFEGVPLLPAAVQQLPAQAPFLG